MKILMIVHGFPPECSGGTESYVLGLSRELRERGHEVVIVCGSHEGAGPKAEAPRVEVDTHDGFTVHRIHRTGLYVDNWEKNLAPEIEPVLDGILAAVRPDLVHVQHWIRLSRNLIEICHDRGIPALCTLHDLWTSCPRAFRVRDDGFCEREASPANCFGCAPEAEGFDEPSARRELELFRDDFRNELALARRIIVPSAAQKELVARFTNAPLGRIRTIPHGTIAAPVVRERAPRTDPEGPVRFAHWGHLSFLKGFDLLLEALRSLPDPQAWSLDVFGGIVYPHEKERIDELAAGLPITWHGPYTPSDLAKTDFDVAIFPSRCAESYSFVLDEAFRLGVPAIVPARGAPAERLRGGGATFAPDSARDLARVLADVVAQPARLDAWRKKIPALPEMSDHAARVERVYREVLSSGQRLPTTPLELRTRRLLHRTWQIESVRRTLESKESDLRNHRRDAEKAKATMDEMNYYHGEKDKVMAWQRGEMARLRELADARDAEIATLRAVAEEKTRAAQRTVDAALAGRIANLESRLTASLSERARLERELAEDRLALAHLRETLAAESRRVAESERHADAVAARIRSLGSTLGGETKRPTPPPAAPSALALGAEVDVIETELKRALRHSAEREAWFEAALEDRDQVIARLARGLDRVLDEVHGQERRRRLGTVPKTAPRERLKILVVIHQYLPRHVAGTEIYTRNLVRELGKRHDVVLLTAESDHSRPRFERSLRDHEGVRIHQFIHNYVWNGFRDTYDCPEADAIFRAVLNEERPDLVHIQHLHYGSVNWIEIAKSRGLPVVYTLHDYVLLCPRDGQMRRADGELCLRPVPTKCRDCIAHQVLDGAPPVLPRGGFAEAESLLPADVASLVRRYRGGGMVLTDPHAIAVLERLDYLTHALRDVDLFISPSEFLRQIFVESGMIAPDRIVVSDNGYDLAPFEKLVRSPIPGELRVTYLGTIAEHKGVHVLVEAMNRIADPRVSCRVWGELSHFPAYADRLRTLATSPNLHFMGPCPPERVPEILSRTDVLVVPSLWWENSPLTVHEAALARIPVVVSDHGGLAEFVLPNRNGLRFRPGDANDLAAKLRSLLASPPAFDFSVLPVKSIRDDAASLETRYRRLLDRPLARS